MVVMVKFGLRTSHITSTEGPVMSPVQFATELGGRLIGVLLFIETLLLGNFWTVRIAGTLKVRIRDAEDARANCINTNFIS